MWETTAPVEAICAPERLESVRKVLTLFGHESLAYRPKKMYKYRTMSELKSQILAKARAGEPGRVWTPADFATLGSRDAVDKALQRLALAGNLRRIDRGLYDVPAINRLTKRPTTPDYRAVIDALARRDQLRMLVDGMTAANDLGLTDAVPARVTIHTDARRRSIKLDNLVIEFKQTAPSRLYWAGRPAMRVVQALHWLKDTLTSDRRRILDRLAKVLMEPTHGASVHRDLVAGFATLPAWMQDLLRELDGFDPRKTGSGSVADNPPARPSSSRRSVKHAGVPR